MTIQSKRLLKLLKKAQRTEDGKIYIDTEDMVAKTIVDGIQKQTVVNLSSYKDSLISTLSYLEDADLISYSRGFCKVRSKGWHLGQERFSAFCSFITKSIIVPILISAVTTLATIWLNDLFK